MSSQKVSVLTKLKSPWLALFFSLLCMTFTVKHGALLYFHSIGISDPGETEYILTCISIAVMELSIIMLSIHGSENASVLFSVVVFSVNILYFYTIAPLGADWISFAPGLIWSFTFAYTLYYYGELFVSLHEREEKSKIKAERLEGLSKENHDLKSSIMKLEKEITEREKVITKREEEITKVVGEVLKGKSSHRPTLINKKNYWKSKSRDGSLSAEEKAAANFRVKALELVLATDKDGSC